MESWHNLQIKVTSSQLNKIEEYKRRNSIKNDSQFLKEAIKNLISSSKIQDGQDAGTRIHDVFDLYRYFHACFNEPKLQRMLEQFFKEYIKKRVSNFALQDEIKNKRRERKQRPFTEKKKIGRPKKITKRGRPKDIGSN